MGPPASQPGQYDTHVLSNDRANSILALSIVMPILVLLFVAARFMSRKIQRITPGMEDWLLVAATIFFFAQTAVQLNMLFAGWLGHQIDRIPDQSSKTIIIAKSYIAAQILYACVLCCARISLCFLFVRLFRVTFYKMFAYANMGLTLAWTLYTIVLPAIRCKPFAKNWNQKLEGHCIDELLMVEIFIVWGLVCDIITWVLPLPVVFRLQMPLRLKLAVYAIFALGIFVITIGALRIWTSFLFGPDDVTWTGALTEDFDYLQCGIAIIAACGPVLRPVFDRLLRRAGITMSSSYRRQYEPGEEKMPKPMRSKKRTLDPYDPSFLEMGNWHGISTTETQGQPVDGSFSEGDWMIDTPSRTNSGDQHIRVHYEVSVTKDIDQSRDHSPPR